MITEKKWGRVLFAALIVLFMTSLASSSVLIDSQDWTDVYSGMYQSYENWDRGEPYFVKNPSASNILSGNVFPVSNVTIIQSSDNPYNGNMEANLNSAPGDFNVREVIETESANLDLIPENQENFIVVPEDYPAAAVISVPLARVTDSWVLIVNDENLDQIEQRISEADGNVMMIGSFTRNVKERLSQYADEEITSPNSHKLSVKIAKRFKQEKNFDTVILTPANSLSKTVFKDGGRWPVLITYNRAPSASVENYLKEDGKFVKTVLLGSPENSVIGNSLDDSLTRDLTVIVKFGQARGDSGGNIYAPSLFSLPGSNYNIAIDSAFYEPSSGKVFVTYRNPSEVKVFELSSFNIKSNGEVVASASDDSPVLIPSQETKTVSYEVDLSSSEIGNGTKLAFSTSYGSNPDSLDKVLTNRGKFSQPYEMNLTVSNVSDKSNLSLKNVVYSKSVDRFKVTLENNGPVKAYATVDIRDVSIRGQDKSFSSGQESIESGETKEIYVTPNPALDKIDIQENEKINVVVNYGAEEGTKLKEINKEVKFKTSGIPIVGSFSSATTGVAAVVVLLIAGLIAERKFNTVSKVVENVR